MRPELECFNLKHRVFLVKNYYQYMGDYLCVKTKYEDQYKDSIEFPTFSYDILMEIIGLFERTGSVLKIPERFSNAPAESRIKPIERIFVKEDDFPVAEEQDSLKIASTDSDQTGTVKDTPEDAMAWEQDKFSDNEDSNLEIIHEMKPNQFDKYICDLCKETFNESSDLRTHQIQIHKIENQALVKIQKIQDDEKGKSACKGKDSRKTTLGLRQFCKDAFTRELSSNPMDSASAQQNTSSISDLNFLQLNQSDDTEQTLTGSAVIVSLDPYYDRKFNEITRKLDQLLKMQKKTTDFVDNDSGIDLNITFPIQTKEEFVNLNKNLTEDEYRMAFVKELSKVNGTSGTCDGKKAAYKLCDYVFHPKLLSHYTWTGTSKTGITKECFSRHTNIVDVFGEIIMIADNRYSIADNEKFFKEKILKYSVVRSKRKKLH